jgi:hypothetical protein
LLLLLLLRRRRLCWFGVVLLTQCGEIAIRRQDNPQGAVMTP